MFYYTTVCNGYTIAVYGGTADTEIIDGILHIKYDDCGCRQRFNAILYG